MWKGGKLQLFDKFSNEQSYHNLCKQSARWREGEEGPTVCIKYQLAAEQDLQRLQLRSYGAMISRDCLPGLSAPTADREGRDIKDQQASSSPIQSTPRVDWGSENTENKTNG